MDFLKVIIAILIGFGIKKTTSLSTSVSENGNFTISAARTNWISSCKVGTPALVNVHWDTLSLDGDIPLPENGSRVWIGYYRQYQYFSVKGCASAGSGGTRIGNIDNPLGHCYYLCKHLSHIGLAGAMCHCLSDDAFNVLPINNATCSYETCGSGLVCGNNRTMWVYGVEKKNVSSFSIASNSVKGKCVSLTRFRSATWRADQCSLSYRALCMENDGTFDAKEAAVIRGVSWGTALKICHDKLENLANISRENYRSVIINQHIPDFHAGWTSFVRDMVVGTGGFDEKLTDLVDCAVIYKSDGKIKLDYQDCINNFPAVCLNGATMINTITASTPTSHNTRPVGQSKRTTTLQLPTTEMTKTTPESLYESTTLKPGSAQTTMSCTFPSDTTMLNSSQTALSTEELIVLRAVVGSLAGLLVTSVLLNYCQFRKIRRSQMENKNKRKFEDENMDYYNMSVKEKTNITRGHDESSNISTQTVLNGSRSDDQGYTTLNKLERNTEK